MPRHILLLSGYIGSGKDTVADYLVSMKGYTKYALADCLKDFTSKKYNFPIALCYTHEGKDMPYTFPNGSIVSIRDLLIKEGAEQRAKDENVWINYVINKVLSETGEDSKIVISDFRFPNEYNKIKEKFNDTRAVRIYRDSVPTKDLESEHLLDAFIFDIFIENNGSKEELFYSLQYLHEI